MLQSNLTQPIYSNDPAPRTTFAPLWAAEAVQQQAEQEMAPVARSIAHKQTATDSALILDQATARIPVQYDARATTPGGSVSVDMVSAEELKQNLIAAERYFTEQAYQQKALGNIEHAANLIGIRDTLHTIYLLSLQAADLAYPSQNPANQIAKATIGGLAGAVKGGADFVQGTQQLICHPQQTIQELENAVKRLDYFIFSLCSDNPQARDELRAGIQQFWDAPIEKKAELATRILVGFKVAPELLGKGIGKIIDAVKEAAIIEKARECASTIGKGIAETAADSKIAEAPVAVTPEGIMLPVEPEGETVVPMEAQEALTEVAHDLKCDEFSADQISTIKTISENDLPHIFRNRSGHFAENTEANRKLLLDIASDPNNFLGQCERESLWYAKTQKNGTQVWAEVRNGRIRNGGFNETPKIYNPKTGLKRP